MNEPCRVHADQHRIGPDHWEVIRCAHLRHVAILECGGSANTPKDPTDEAVFLIQGLPGDGRFLGVPPWLAEDAWAWLLLEMRRVVRAREPDLTTSWKRIRRFEAAMLWRHRPAVRVWHAERRAYLDRQEAIGLLGEDLALAIETEAAGPAHA